MRRKHCCYFVALSALLFCEEGFLSRMRERGYHTDASSPSEEEESEVKPGLRPPLLLRSNLGVSIVSGEIEVL